ncbi:hypothetical protein K4L44_16120 [Halosquirtibacter laminarini]|uniref:Uncharacterized protein n=1 Tax=Halosquirtibacter laminarini TaxID=3374600 RepID=A0AC61NET9_9BACT|nr:hypothetical protein K4L44_16120 [Prolixibacteraceae bacterium]
MDKRQRNLAVVSLFVVVVALLGVKSIFKEFNFASDQVAKEVILAEVKVETSSPWSVKTDKKVENYDKEKIVTAHQKKESKIIKRDSVQELKMYCVCNANGCHTCEEIEAATKEMYADNSDMNIKFTTMDLKDSEAKDFVEQMNIKDQSVVLIKGWRKKKVKLSDFQNAHLESVVKETVDGI